MRWGKALVRIGENLNHHGLKLKNSLMPKPLFLHRFKDNDFMSGQKAVDITSTNVRLVSYWSRQSFRSMEYSSLCTVVMKNISFVTKTVMLRGIMSKEF